jgi:hypothetical protein
MRITNVLVSGLLLFPALAPAAELTQAALRASAQKGLVLLEKTSPTFLKIGGCNSCHNQMLPAAAQAFARKRGIATGPAIAQLSPETSEATVERIIEHAGGVAGPIPYEFFSDVSIDRPRDPRIESKIYVLKSMQQPEGFWKANSTRTPLTYDDFTPTAFAILALDRYSSGPQRAEADTRIARARSWLLEAKPATTQERAFQILGLAWSKAGREAIAKAAQGLAGMQRKDGGWSQLPSMPSDAYASGLALYALSQGGVAVKEAVYTAGLKYLLDTQAADGTWHVRARSLPVQPYFESGYPYGHDQWISAAGAAYAVMAISAAVEPQRVAAR